MEARAVVRYARMSPQKARIVVDMIRGKKVGTALNLLHFTNKATARIIEKLIKSARGNAEVKNVDDPDEMKIETIYVDKGPVMKRQLARARGRVTVIQKPFSHVTVVLKETEKAKPEPKAKKKTGGAVKPKPEAEKAGAETTKADTEKTTKKNAKAEAIKKSKPEAKKSTGDKTTKGKGE